MRTVCLSYTSADVTAKLSCISYKRQLLQQTARTPRDYCVRSSYYKTSVLKIIILLLVLKIAAKADEAGIQQPQKKKSNSFEEKFHDY